MPKRLKAPPRVARPVSGSGRLPSVENLLDKSPAELVKTLKRFGIEPDVKAIDRRAIKAFVTLNEKLAEGKMPSEASWERMAKQHEREMAGALRQMTKQAIRLYKHELNEQRYTKKNSFAWITSEGDNVCPDCRPLHGEVDTMANWIRRGLPGTSRHVCGLDCNCELVPAK